MKDSGDFPARFESLEGARAFCRDYFAWYSQEHHHPGIALLPPAPVHSGQADAVLAQRQQVLEAAYAREPERCPGAARE